VVHWAVAGADGIEKVWPPCTAGGVRQGHGPGRGRWAIAEARVQPVPWVFVMCSRGGEMASLPVAVMR